jgi:hypothetical protein
MRRRPILITGSVAAAFAAVWLLATGVGLVSTVVAVLALALQGLAGGVLWSGLRNRTSPAGGIELLGMGLAIGTFISMLSGVLLDRIIPGNWGWAVPSIAGVAVLLLRRFRRLAAPGRANAPAENSVSQVLKAEWSTFAGLVVGSVLGLAAVAVNLVRYPLEWAGVRSSHHPDMLFFEGLANSVAQFGPFDSIFMVGADIRYHWFSYAWVGQLTNSLDLAPFVSLTRMLPLVAVVASAAIAASWTARLTKAIWAPALAAVLITAGGFVGAAYGTVLNFDSPSQSFTTVWLLALSVVFVEYLVGGLDRRALWLVGLLSVACVGGKASSAIVLLGAMGITVGIGLLRRAPWAKRALVAFIVGSVPASIAYAVVLVGSASSGELKFLTWDFRASAVQGLDLSTGHLGIAFGTASLLIAVAPRWAGIVGMWLRPATRWSPLSAFGIGLIVMGLAPIVFVSQGVNELWFALAASAPLAVISAAGLGEAWESLGDGAIRGTRSGWRALVACAVAGPLILLVLSRLWATGGSGVVSARAFGPLLAITLAVAVAGVVTALFAGSTKRALVFVVALITVLVSTSALSRLTLALGGEVVEVSQTSTVAGAPRGFSANAGASTGRQGTVVAASQRDYGDGWSSLEVEAANFLRYQTTGVDTVVTDRTVSALVPALTGRRTYISAVPYQSLYGRADAAAQIAGRVEISQRFAAAPSEADFAELCSSGVTWGWITAAPDGAPVDWAPYATIAYSNPAVTIIRLDTARCPQEEQQ